MSALDPIYVLDELELYPGKLDAFRTALSREYLPGAEQRGMTLLHTWVTPPVEMDEIPVRVILVWRLEGVPGFWTMRSQNATPEIAAWWERCQDFVESRTRRFAAEAEALPGLASDARLHA